MSMIKIKLPNCPFCGKNNGFIELDEKDYHPEKSLIQDIVPTLNVDQRELVKTGICNECWDTVTKEPEDED